VIHHQNYLIKQSRLKVIFSRENDTRVIPRDIHLSTYHPRDNGTGREKGMMMMMRERTEGEM